MRRLQTNEAKLQSEVDRLQHELAAVKHRLAQCEGGIRRTNRGFNPNGIGGFNTTSSMAWPSPDASSEDEFANESFARAVVWMETRNGEPHRLHVGQKQDNLGSQWYDTPRTDHSSPLSSPFHKPGGRNPFSADGEQRTQSAMHFNLSPASTIGSHQVYISSLDTVVVAMEFVLK